MTARPRLSADTLERVVAATPAYDRTVAPRIVHIGVGAFARAHLGVYADDLLQAGWPAAIRGVSLRSPRAEELLAPQDGLYTVVEREPDATTAPRVVGAFTSVRTGPTAAVDAIASPTAELVTLTVTEKGYELTGDRSAPSAPAVIATALARRRAGAAGGMVVASLDNMLGNGDLLRTRVLEAAGTFDATLPAWIESEVRFPSSVVDRMVPATTGADRAWVAAQLGLDDRATVTAEHHRSWVITGTEGLPPLADVGVRVVDDVTPFERRKLWLLNGPHSALAYGGLLFGCETIADAAAHPQVGAFVARLVDEVLEVADLPPAVEPSAFAADALRRFRNPSLGHTCAQVGEDGSRKLPQRLLPVFTARQQAGRPTGRAAVVVAAWIALAARLPVGGQPFAPVADPAADELRAAADRGDLQALCGVALPGYPDLVGDVAADLQRLLKDGPTGFR